VPGGEGVGVVGVGEWGGFGVVVDGVGGGCGVEVDGYGCGGVEGLGVGFDGAAA